MGRVNTPKLSETEIQALETVHRTSTSHCLRVRCQVILLKSKGLTSKEVGDITKMSNISVNSWVTRYKSLGLEGLKTQPGRGRKPKLDKKTDSQAIMALVKQHRQRLSTAKAEWEKQSGRSISLTTLKTFLKVLTDATNE